MTLRLGSNQERMPLDPWQVEAALLVEVIELAPEHLTPSQLVRHMSGKRDEGEELKAAIRGLKDVGFLKCIDGVVVPTRAAVHAHKLLTF